MLRPRFARILAALGLATFLSAPLSAQLDPRLQKDKTDFLDLYQQTNTQTLKPEIATVFDFSGSMNRLMFHRLFPNNWADEDKKDTNSGYTNICVVVNSTGSAISSVRFGTGSGSTSLTISGKTYTIGGAPVQVNGVWTNTLIKPDGTPVVANDVNALPATDPSPAAAYSQASLPAAYTPGSSTASKDARNWVRAASHVRLQCTYDSVTRNVDFPLNWAVLPTNGWRNAGGPVGAPLDDGSSPYMIGSILPRETVKDPVTGTWYDLDTTYLGAQTGDVMLRYVNNVQTANIGNSDATNVGLYRTRYIEWIFWGQDGDGHYCIPDAISTSLTAIDPASVSSGSFTFTTSPKQAFSNGLPNRNRVQAVKEAAIRTWLSYQKQVYWAFRSLAYTGATPSQATNSPTTIPVPTNNSTSGDQTWYLLNGDTDNGVRRISKLIPNGGTPLTQSHASVYAQLQNVDPFARVEIAPDDKPQDCMKHFMILFTDGAPNESPSPSEGAGSFPYVSGAAGGNAAVKANLTGLDSGSTYYNSPTLAGVAAHGGDKNIGVIVDPLTVTYPSSGSISSFAPFAIKSRGTGSNALTFAYPHPIQTMTVGVSLGVNWSGTPNQPIALNILPKPINTDTSSAKYRLMATATFGDPATKTWDMATVKPFALTDPSNPNSSKDPNSVYFFDGSDPQTLVENLAAAFRAAVALSGNNATSKPTVPFVGLGLASEIYLGTFQIPSSGGPVWSGDLQMFPTRQENGQTLILDKSGAVAAVVNNTTAMWTAADALVARGWANRKVFTRLPATTSVPNPPLVPFAYRPTSGSTSAFDAIKAYIGPSTLSDDAKNKIIELVLGADTSSTAVPLPSRPAHPDPNSDVIGIMGDVIDSAPAAVEYTLTDALKAQLPTALATAANNAGARFRVIFVGTNLGMLHAFGEVSWPDSTVDPTKPPLTRGVVDELWAFVPTDLLSHLDYITGINPHRFLMDGSPYVYHLDIAPGHAMLGNGTVDSTETARVIFGLRKGGRSYYALDIHDPFTPAMSWALSPDEVTATPGILDGRIEANNPAVAKALVQNMGFSSSNLAVGRVNYGSPAVYMRDVLFLGGGFSTPDIDSAFGTGVKLGRSALALDVSTGNILMAWDFLNDSALNTTAAGMGPVGTGLMPFEYFLNSGLVQRAYFSDFSGNLWALGSGKTTVANDGDSYRLDTSNLDAWTQDGSVGGALSLRKIYASSTNDYVTTLPAPFLTGNVPTSAGALPVGIAMSTGNRDNPLDSNYTSTTSPTQHETMVLFDNQQATLGGTSITPSDLYVVPDSAPGITPPEVTPGNALFYLANGKRGYTLRFPAKTGGFIPKGINEPLVLGGAMFFSYFTPTSSDPCTGGNGITNSNRICDVLYPVYQGNTTTVTNSYTGPCVGGHMFSWSGVATNFSARSTVSVNQAGVVSTGGTGAPGSSQTQIQTIFGQVRDRLPRPRTWRTVR